MTDLPGADLCYVVAIVDRREEFLFSVTNSLQLNLPRRYLVKTYAHADDFLTALHSYPLHVPLLVVADREASTPDVPRGVFARATEVVPRCRGVLFSGRPVAPEGQEMLNLGVLRAVVNRGARSSEEELLAAVQKGLEEFESTVDYQLIERFCRMIRTTPHPALSPIDGDDEDLSPLAILTEMALGTPRGLEYLRGMLPRSSRTTSKAVRWAAPA